MNWMKYKKVYFTFSGVLIGISAYSLIAWGLKLGVDFTGGSIVEYQIDNLKSTEDATKKLEEAGIEVESIQLTGDGKYLFRMESLTPEKKNTLDENVSEISNGQYQELRYETVGPSIGPELVKKTVYAILIAAAIIMLWVAYQFKSFKYGTSAILAMFHDTFILVGSFAVLGHFIGAETDFLFVTALLTTLSFSVHDTIVVYDRIRETQRKESGNIVELANRALTETMVRSLNNSFTIMFMLLALILLGGTTVVWFAVALFIGTILGTYSSPFVAVPLLVTFDGAREKLAGLFKRRKK
jgi:preprotein translocase subunit SecF